VLNLAVEFNGNPEMR